MGTGLPEHASGSPASRTAFSRAAESDGGVLSSYRRGVWSARGPG